jgi:hypothetical protein
MQPAGAFEPTVTLPMLKSPPPDLVVGFLYIWNETAVIRRRFQMQPFSVAK